MKNTMWGRGALLTSFALVVLGTAKCPERKTSPVREILCYTSISDVQLLADSVCSCTTLVHQNHDVKNLSISDISDLRESLKEMHPFLQFVISIHDPAMTFRNSAMVRQEAIARIIAVMKKVDGVELNVTAGSKERLYNFVKSLKDEMIRKSYDKRIFMALPIRSEDLAKQFDIKELVKYVDLFTLSTDYMTDKDGAFVTFHPSRLIGLFDMLNTDSLIDLISELGAPKQKIIMTLPVNAYKFTLKNSDENAPRSETTEREPVSINRKQLCEAINNGEWTVERDEDLTAPYAFQNKTWIAFEDKISVGIKGKYVLLRNLAGLAVRNIENDVKTECEISLTQEIYHSFTEFRRKSRRAVLSALEDELHQMQFSYPNHAKTSSFRITRVVDTEGHIRAIRENTQTEFVCRRQGYFVHPKSCNRFYRCVKFNQAIEDYSVFEFDCPAGLSFDERTEVCVWPGSLPEGSPCPGSSEIAPVAPKRFECSQPGYFADPQNCRWFFACMDLGGEELMAFEFRCPYGLVFDEKKLVCEWPWLVPACSESGSGYTRTEYNYGGYTAGTSTGVRAGGYVTSSLPEYSVTAGTDYSDVDYFRTIGTGLHDTNYFGTTVEDIKHPGLSISGAGHVGLSSPSGTDYFKSIEYGGASSVPTYSGSSGIQIGSISPNTIVEGEHDTRFSTTSSKIGDGYTVSTAQDSAGYSIPDGFNTGFANTGSLGGVTAGFSGSTMGKYSGFASGSHLGEVTASFSRPTPGEYFKTASRSHLREQGVTYSERPTSSYSISADGYTGSISTSNPIIDTSYSRTESSGSTILPGSSVNVHIQSTSPKHDGSTNIYAGSNMLNTNSFLASTGVYSGATGRQPSFGETGSSFGYVSYPGANGNVEITDSTNREYTGSTVYKDSTGARYSTVSGDISADSIENNINVPINSEIGSPYSTTSSGQVSETDFINGVSKSKLETSRISTVSGHVSITPRPTGISSTDYRSYNDEKGYTIPVFIRHEEPSLYPSIGNTGAEVRSHIGTTKSEAGLTAGYGKTNLNISIFGNEIPIGYDVQTGSGAIQTEGNIDGNITGDSFSGTVFSYGNVPGAVSTPSINKGTILSERTPLGYVTTSSGTPGYVTSDRVKNVDVGSVSPETLTYEIPNPKISVSGPSTANVLSKDDSTPNIFRQIPGVSIGGSIQPGLTIESSTRKSYESVSTYPPQYYHGSGTPTKDSVSYSSSTPNENLIPIVQGYRTEGYDTVTYNAAYDTSKYTKNDVPYNRPTNAILPDSLVFRGRVKSTEDSISGSTFEASTTSGYSLSKSAVFTPSGFTKTGPTKTGITTAILGGGGSYSVSTGDHRPTYSPDNISEKAFEGNIAGYTKTSIDGQSVTLSPPGYSSIKTPGGRFTVQSAISGYTYPKPTVQFGASGATFSSMPIVSIENNISDTSKPFFSRLPTSTVRPVTYTTEYPEIYRTTPFESFKISTSVPTVRPVIETGYKISRPVSPTTIPLTDNQFIERTDDLQNAQITSVSTSKIGLEVTSQGIDSNGQTGYSSSLGYLPAKSTGVSTTKYDLYSTVTTQPELGITYKKPSLVSDVTHDPSWFQSPTTFKPSNVYYSGQRFSTTSSPLGPTPSGGSPTNLDISRDKIDKLITNYDRGTIKYTPTECDTYSSSGFGSTSSKKFTSSLSTKSAFSTKTGGGFAVTTPYGIQPSTLSYEVTTKSTEDKGKIIVKWSDLHPLLLGKLGAECTCKADPFANLRGPGKKLIDSSKGKVNLANYDSSEIYVDLGYSEGDDYSTNYDVFPDQPYKISPHETTTVSTNLPSSFYLPTIDTKTSAKNNELRSGRRMGKKLEYEEEEEEEEEKEEYDNDPDQIINGVTDCARPGLFRHPGLCNKFYACHWDQWKKKFTLHIFNCPVHLTFDSSVSACNWPSKGPACQAGNLLV